MDDGSQYWAPLIELRNRLRFLVRIAWRDGDLTEFGTWGNLFISPTSSYLEGPDGPWPLCIIEWVEVSTAQVQLRVGKPPEFTDIEMEILEGLRGAQMNWEPRHTSWSLDRHFEDEPVKVLRFVNPFGPPPLP